VPIGEPALLPAVVRRLDDAGIVITELALRGSSLDEVFLSLTGREPEARDWKSIDDEEARA
jgi:oleandomycin transport system ATP-binding protein